MLLTLNLPANIRQMEFPIQYLLRATAVFINSSQMDNPNIWLSAVDIWISILCWLIYRAIEWFVNSTNRIDSRFSKREKGLGAHLELWIFYNLIDSLIWFHFSPGHNGGLLSSRRGEKRRVQCPKRDEEFLWPLTFWFSGISLGFHRHVDALWRSLSWWKLPLGH